MKTDFKINFASDYMEGAHPAILGRLAEINLNKTVGYGTDAICESARNRIRKACSCPEAAVHFLVGGTQTNATVIDALLASYQGVFAADTGHISVHEAGAVEADGHKVICLPQTHGKISAATIQKAMAEYRADENAAHMVMPGMVYLSQPTEYGTLYSLAELEQISAVCRENGLYLYVDGARLAYALAGTGNDVGLPELARLTDAFYIGGTKCGTLFGEAVVLPDPALIPHFFTIIKQHGALLAKGWLLGVQFDTLFENDLYQTIGKEPVKAAGLIQDELEKNGFSLLFRSSTNQVFVVLENAMYERFNSMIASGFWEKPDKDHTTVRLATSWATTPEQTEQLLSAIRSLKK